MKTFSQFIEESNQVLLSQIQEEIVFLEEQLSVCEDEELAESIASRLRAVKKRGAGIAKRAAVAGLAAAAVAGGPAAKAADFSGNVNVSRGAVPAQATNQSVRSAVDRAIANPGQPQSASSEKGRMKTTVSGGINVSGRFGGGEKKEKKEKKDKVDRKERARAERQQDKSQERNRRRQRRLERQTPDPEPKFRDTLAGKKRGQEKRFAHLQKKDKFNTKYRYAVPTGTGGRFNTRQASGPNQMTDFKAVKTNKSGGTNYQRTKVVGDPSGSGGTGRTVSAKRYDKLFGDGGRYAPKGDGSTKYIPSKLGKPFNPKGYQPNKFVK